ncbi:MAG: phosphodiester glycosidase family protein [Bacilli bacterium]|nr:phosphodiester glycosidase family protein [Bacilli bacterium]
MKRVKKKSNNQKRLWTIITILFALGDIIAITGFIVMYGPWTYFQNLFVTTAMKTRNHQYFAYVFYTEEKVKSIMASNYFVSIKEDVNLDDIVIDTGEKNTYKDEYEKELLTRDPGNDSYKVLDVKVGNAKGYLVAIYEPEKVRLIRTEKFDNGTFGARVIDMCKRYGGSVCINGGGFANGLSNGSDIPMGYVIDDGEVIWSSYGSESKGNIIGLTEEGKLKLMNKATGAEAVDAGIKYGLEFGPFLIVNGKSMEIHGMPYGVANKCVIAQRKDGVIMFLVTEGETYIDGASLKDVIETLEKYGAYNAANLDGGQSTSLVINNELINTPNYLAKKQGGRYVVTGFGLIP